MPPPPLLTVRDLGVTFGGPPLFDALSFAIHRGERICLVGRNGCGKSTLLKVLGARQEADDGDIDRRPGLSTAFLPQEPQWIEGDTVAQHVSRALSDGDADDYRVQRILDEMVLDGSAPLSSLSGGEARRADLAAALVEDRDLLLLDEPTNHLDLATILWLEERLRSYPGALVLISHDRRFLSQVSNRMLWLDRGVLRQSDKGFEHFDDWVDQVEREEELELGRMNTRLRQENRWLARGVTARRKRNMGRLRALQNLRKQRATLLAGRTGSLSLTAQSDGQGGKRVIEAEDISKTYDHTPVIDRFSTRILKGDRIGLIGPNGAGKTTLLRILTGDMAPDSGTVRLGTGLNVVTFDQKRQSLDPEKSLWDILCPMGGDQVTVQGQPRHVVSYLKDFLFDERQARSPVKSLSGGERNRLLLARILAQPSNLMVLDEPTNDLDMDTLDLLCEALGDYQGTLLLVSHDRDFLDRLVTSVIAFEGDGNLVEHAGGYSDYVARTGGFKPLSGSGAEKEKKAARTAVKPKAKKPAGKLSYKDQRELDSLPAEMTKMALEISALEEKLHDPDLFNRDPTAFHDVTRRLEALQQQHAMAEERWLELEMRREELEAG